MTITEDPRLVSGAWRDGDPVGDRQFLAVGDLELERGGVLPGIRVSYETWGRLSPSADNAVLVEHALTGDSHVVGPAGPGHASPGWWDGLIGPGKALDTDRWFVVASNVLGGCQGTTGPSTRTSSGRPWGSRFPFVTIRDQVEVEARLADSLGVGAWAGVIGGSMGGMRALEWAVTHPSRVSRLVLLATGAHATADQIAWCQPQLLAIRQDPDFHGGDYYGHTAGPDAGLGIARRIAHITYRSGLELDERFGRDAQGTEQPLGAGGRYAVESYLDHHAGKLSRRFDANSYLVLTEAMNSHDVGRDRGGVAAALARVTASTTVVGVDSDRLYPVRLSDEIAAGIRGATQHTISSPFGHDGFLIEVDSVGRIVAEQLGR
ncbi:homoserine O-acetyltransferase [Lapillicoccus sp.]|uniref:homoserine O-acetyltransferase MetX n=1 Tax=Lapillicoccus sp. TaxID=1909287 RepID=UPI0025CEFF5C|nr:homoserine O-acetyltransferase [Lapillicoccus sp.]